MLQIGNSYLYTENTNCIYKEYIISLIKEIIEDKYFNIVIGSKNYIFNNTNPKLIININYEHTLVKKGGRSTSKNTPIGTIKYGNDNYHVRIVNNEVLNLSNIVIDYSLPNIYNVKESRLFNELSKKYIYIASTIYKNIYTNINNRSLDCLTTFLNTGQPRRDRLLNEIKKSNINHNNINNCFDKTKLQELYQKTKVIINIHQTEHHDTFEELRCLPAIQNGVIIVSEISPLNYLIPYNDLIIWSEYDNIIDKTKEVLENYEKYYKEIFTEKNINLLYKLHMDNKNEIKKKIEKDFDLEYYAIKYGLDKSIHSGCHNYIPGYAKLFDKIRYNVKNIMEIGIGSVENGQMGGSDGPLVRNTNYKTGNSLKCWKEYFCNADIYGIDIYSHPELNESRIKTFVADQSNKKELENVVNEINKELDIIIDDGSHIGEHQVFSFICLNEYLSPNGIYVIEDVQPQNIDGFKDLSIFSKDIQEYIKNNFYVEYFDTRHTNGRKDDFIISFTKKI